MLSVEKKITEKDYFALHSDIPNVLEKKYIYTYFLIFSVFFGFFFFFFFFFFFCYPVKTYYSI